MNVFSYHCGTRIDVIKTIVGRVIADEEVSEKTKKRINELGLNSLEELAKINTIMSVKGGSFKNKYKEISKEIVDNLLWEKADKVKTRTFSYSKNDFENALNFLEIFCFYSNQSNLIFEKKELEKHVYSEDTILYDKHVAKCVIVLEEINDLLNSTKSIKKGVIKLKLQVLDNLINKIFSKNLTLTEQNALIKYIDKAKKVLSEIV
jgi:hypothetical protein